MDEAKPKQPQHRFMGRLMQKQVGGISLIGFSLAGEETLVAAPEYNVCFDVGRSPREVISIDNLCLSHGHMDHAAGVAYYLSQRGFIGNTPGQIIAHERFVDSLNRLMEIWATIEGHPIPGKITGVKHLDEVTLRRGLFVRAFDVNHSPGALGFTLLEVRHKLKPELQGKTGPELVAMKRERLEIEDHVEVPVLTYTGDTALGPFLDLDFVRNSQVVVMECTFFDREHRSRALAGKHIHAADLPQVFSAIPDAQFLITHLSRRTDLRQAKRILQRTVKPEDAERITLLMERQPQPNRPGNNPIPP